MFPTYQKMGSYYEVLKSVHLEVYDQWLVLQNCNHKIAKIFFEFLGILPILYIATQNRIIIFLEMCWKTPIKKQKNFDFLMANGL